METIPRPIVRDTTEATRNKVMNILVVVKLAMAELCIAFILAGMMFIPLIFKPPPAPQPTAPQSLDWSERW